MTAAPVDISDAFEWEEDLPRPRWELIATRIAEAAGPDDLDETWTTAGRQWLEALRDALGPNYHVEESPRTLLLAPRPEPSAEVLLGFAAACRQTLSEALPGVAQFPGPGKQVLLVLRDSGDYYRYVAVYYPEGRSGDSGGMQIREGYRHIAVWGIQLGDLERIIAHEMTHASLAHLSMPQWVEEGLAQMFEHDMAGRSPLLLDPRDARQHKQVWARRGLDDFWSGAGFYQAGKVQKLSYQLAEVLIRLLVEEHRPGWFGWRRARQHRFLDFLREADASDAGEAAARKHLGLGLRDVAAWFLGPGDWKPGMKTDETPTTEPQSAQDGVDAATDRSSAVPPSTGEQSGDAGYPVSRPSASPDPPPP